MSRSPNAPFSPRKQPARPLVSRGMALASQLCREAWRDFGAPGCMEVAMERKQTMNGTWAALLGGVALGALSMYMLDPVEGRRRRATVRDKTTRAAAKTSDTLNAAACDLGARVQSIPARIRQLFGRKTSTNDRILVNRVRSRMGRAVSHPRAIEVGAYQGRVILSGAVLAKEKDQLLDTVRMVPGVKDVDCRLDEHEE